LKSFSPLIGKKQMKLHMGRICKSRWLSSARGSVVCITAALVFGLALVQRADAATPNGAPDTKPVGGSLVGIQYEQWFHRAESWKTAESVPMLGKYITDEPTVAKHYAEFQQLGFDWLLIDWSNMLWATPTFEEHVGDTRLLEEKTAVLFQTALHLRQQGKYAPKLVFMLGLQNGPPVANGIDRLNGILTWLKTNYLDRREYKDLWLYEGGKPLLTVLYWPPDPCTELHKTLATGKLQTQDWTTRWMATQLQDNHAEQCGMWSWMDGVIPQVLTRRNGVPDEIVVTPSAFRFPGKGWTHPSAIARDHGVPYLESWKAAFDFRPKFIQVHQWNEFAGQENGQGFPADYWGQKPAGDKQAPLSNVYGDEYNVQLSDDIEPTDLRACAYRGCGGWGYYYYNLTRAIVSLYRGNTPDITVLALSGPTAPLDPSVRTVDLRWAYLGKAPSSFSISVDGMLIASALTGSSYRLQLPPMKIGTHRVQLTAAGVETRFSLDESRMTALSAQPLPVTSEVTLEYAVNAAAK
jgi:hypothetical protein